VSTWQSYGPNGGFGSKRFATGSERRRLSWRDMQPLLLRSAGVVGLAGAIVAVISSDSLFVGASPEPQSGSALVEELEPVAAAAVIGPAESAPEPAETPAEPAETTPRAELPELLGPATGVFQPAAYSGGTRAPDRAANMTAPMAPTAAPPSAVPSEAAAVRPSAAPAPAPSTPPPQVATAVAAPPPFPPAAQAIAAPPSGQADDELEAGEGDAALWPDEAVECPRAWVSVEGATETAHPDCVQAAPPLADVAAVEEDQRALGEAAVERASEIGGLEFVARLPQARPEPPPKPIRKTVAKKRRGDWPSDPPPNCGSKRAKWRYVDKVPTWYCRG
jgi:hypothetical protein